MQVGISGAGWLSVQTLAEHTAVWKGHQHTLIALFEGQSRTAVRSCSQSALQVSTGLVKQCVSTPTLLEMRLTLLT